MGSLKVPALVAGITETPATAVRPSGRLTHDPVGKKLAIHDGVTPGGLEILLDVYQRPEAGSIKRSLLDRVSEGGLVSLDFIANLNIEIDVTSFLQAAINAGDLTILKRAYVISAPLVLPAGRTVKIEPGTRFLYKAETGAAFELADRTNILVTVAGGEWTVECPAPKSAVSCVQGFGVNHVKVTGAFGINCTQIFFETTARNTPYADVVTPDMKDAGDPRQVNVSRYIEVVGGGCTTTTGSPTNPSTWLYMRAGALMVWCYDWVVRDATYSYCYCGVQFWGGDSGFENFQNGSDFNAVRKNRRFRILNCRMDYGHAGFWGSFGQDFLVSTCFVYENIDVGHDYEGCKNGRGKNLHAENCYNGNYSTFALNEDILFENCDSVVTNKDYELFRQYNSSQNGALNKGVAWHGGSLVCKDPTGLARIDSSFGPAKYIVFKGATIRNAYIDFNTNNNCIVIVQGNDIRWTIANPTAVNAITVGQLHNAGCTPHADISDNVIYSEVEQPAGSRVFVAYTNDFNDYAHVAFRGNDCWVRLVGGGFAGAFCEDSGGNAPAGRFMFEGNRIDGPIIVKKSGAGDPIGYSRNNFTSGNADVTITVQ